MKKLVFLGLLHGSLTLYLGAQSTAVDSTNTAPGFDSSAVGRQNDALGRASTAVGHSNQAGNNNEVQSTDQGTIDIAHGQSASAVGRDNLAEAYKSSAFGYRNTATGSGAVSFGYRNQSSHVMSSAVGSRNVATHHYAAAIGSQNIVTGFQAVGLGTKNSASAHNAVAVGFNSQAQGLRSVAVGTGVIASSKDSVAFGLHSSSSSLEGVAIGYFSHVDSASENGVSVGQRNYVNAQNAVALGGENMAQGRFSAAVGTINWINPAGEYASAIGYYNRIYTAKATAVGYQNTVTGVNSSAFGSNITNDIADTTMIGPTNGSKITIQTTGVGIGTTTPEKKLHVVGDTKFQGAVTITGTLTAGSFSGNGAGFTNLDASNITSGTIPDVHISSNIPRLAGNNSFAGNITTTGNVAIGTSSPSAKLEVSGAFNNHITVGATGAAGNINFKRGSDGLATTRVGWLNGATGTLFGIENGSSGGEIRLNPNHGDNSGFVTLYSANVEALRATGGKVGIGTSNPQAKLTVAGSGNTTGQAMLVTDSSNVQRLSVLDNGNVAIGVGTPSSKLDVRGGSLRVRGNPSGAHYFDVTSVDASGTKLSDNYGYIALSTNTSGGTPVERFRVTGTGNVGIGTTAPSAKLHVSGSAMVDGDIEVTGIVKVQARGGIAMGQFGIEP